MAELDLVLRRLQQAGLLRTGTDLRSCTASADRLFRGLNAG